MHFCVQAPNLAQMSLGSCPTDSEGVPNNRTVGAGVRGREQFCQCTVIPHLARQEEKETPGNRCILLSKGSVRYFNKILVKFILFYEGGGRYGCQPSRWGVGKYTYS